MEVYFFSLQAPACRAEFLDDVARMKRTCSCSETLTFHLIGLARRPALLGHV